MVTNQSDLTDDVNRQMRSISIDSKLNLFIPGLIALKYVLDDEGKRCGPTACTDGYTVWINRDYWNSSSGPQKVGLLFHEMLHCMWLHFFRFSGAEMWLANMACDIVINRFIRQLAQHSKSIELPKNPPEGEIVDSDEYGDASEEVIYNRLAQEFDEEDDSSDGDDQGEGSDSPDQNGQDGQDGSDSNGPKQKKRTPKPKKPSNYCGPGDFMMPDPDAERGDDGDEEGDSEEEKKSLQEQLKELRDKWESTKQTIAQTAKIRGDLPAGLAEMLDKSSPQVDWKSILLNFILNTSVVDISEDTFDRRYLSEGQYLEAIDQPAISDIIFSKDTSGSMNRKWLSQSCSEIQYAMQSIRIQRLWVLDIDCGLEGEIKEYGPHDEIDFSARGRGGTDFRPPFRWAIEECPTQPACLIYFTDGDGPFPKEPPPFPVLWMTFRKPPEEYPFGTVIDMRNLVS